MLKISFVWVKGEEGGGVGFEEATLRSSSGQYFGGGGGGVSMKQLFRDLPEAKLLHRNPFPLAAV